MQKMGNKTYDRDKMKGNISIIKKHFLLFFISYALCWKLFIPV